MSRLDRICAYARYLELLQAQYDALEVGDTTLFGSLADARDQLAAAVDRLPPLADPAAARELLGRCVELDVRVRERLQALREGVRNRLRDMEVRRPGLVPYLTAQGAAARLDRVS